MLYRGERGLLGDAMGDRNNTVRRCEKRVNQKQQIIPMQNNVISRDADGVEERGQLTGLSLSP